MRFFSVAGVTLGRGMLGGSMTSIPIQTPGESPTIVPAVEGPQVARPAAARFNPAGGGLSCNHPGAFWNRPGAGAGLPVSR